MLDRYTLGSELSSIEQRVHALENERVEINTQTAIVHQTLKLAYATPNTICSINNDNNVVSENLSTLITGKIDQTTVIQNPDATITVGTVQDIGSGSVPTFGGLDVNGDINVTGTVDNVDISELHNDFIAHTLNSTTAHFGQDLKTTAQPTFAQITVNNFPQLISDVATKGYVDNNTHANNWQNAVISIYDSTTGTPPNPVAGDRYLSLTTTSSWNENNIYEWSGATWQEVVPSDGYVVFILSGTINPRKFMVYNSVEVDWRLFDTNIDHQSIIGSGVNTHSQIDAHLANTTNAHFGQDLKSTANPTFNMVNLSSEATQPFHVVTKSYVDAYAQGVIWQNEVISFYDPTNGLPIIPLNGDRYISLATSHNWIINRIYQWDSANTKWIETAPIMGFATFVEGGLINPQTSVTFNGNNWVKFASTLDHKALQNIGVNSHAQIDTHIANNTDAHFGQDLKSTASPTFNSLTITSTTSSTSISTGAFVISGGLGVNGEINAQTIRLDGHVQTSSITTGTMVINGGLGVTNDIIMGGNLQIHSMVDSSDTNTGSMIIAGGVAVQKNINISGVERIYNTANSTNIASGALIVDGGVGMKANLNVGHSVVVQSDIQSGTLHLVAGIDATDTFTGTLCVAGGASIVDNVVIGNNLIVENTINTQNGFIDKCHITGTQNTTDASTGVLIVSGGVSMAADVYVGGNMHINNSIDVQNITMSTLNVIANIESTSISTGTAQIIGGIGVTGNSYIGGNSITLGESQQETSVILSTDNATNLQTGAVHVAGGISIIKDTIIGGNLNVVENISSFVASITSTSDATDTLTGALHVAGGASIVNDTVIGGNLSVGGFCAVPTMTITTNINATDTLTGALKVNGGASFGENLYIGGQTILQNNVTITITTNATDSSTGSLTTNGGIGVNKDLYVGGNENINGILFIQNSLDSTNVTTGSLTTTGGVGIERNLNVGGNANIVGTITSQSLHIISTNDSSSSTTGAVTIFGGMGIEKNLNIGSDVFVSGTISGSESTISGLSSSNTCNIEATITATDTQTGALVISGGIGIAKDMYVGGNTNLINFVATTGILTSTINSSDPQTGSLIVSGGIGLEKDICVGGNVNIVSNNNATNSLSGSLSVLGGVGITDDMYVGGSVHISNTLISTICHIVSTNNATNTLSGALQIDGGANISKDIYIGQNGIIEKTLTATNIIVISTQTTTSSSTGALQIIGGMSVGQNMYVNDQITTNTMNITATQNATNTSTGAMQITGGMSVVRNIIVGGDLQVNNHTIINDTMIVSTTVSTSISTGALVISGGMGIIQDVNIGGTLSGMNIQSNSTTDSTNSITGALQIVGGVGVKKNVCIGGNLYVDGITTINNEIILGTETSTNTASGALQVIGGMGIGADATIGGILTVETQMVTNNLQVNGSQNASDSITGSIVIAGGMGIAEDIYLGGKLDSSTANIRSTIDTTDVSSGALIVTGGVAIQKRLSVGDNIVTNGTIISPTINTTSTLESTDTLTGSFIVVGGMAIGGNINLGKNLSVAGNTLLQNTTIQSTIESSSGNTGALIINGGLGVQKNINCENNLNVTKQITTSSANITSTNNSTDTNTGALNIVGGMSIGKNMNIGGQVFIKSTINTTSTSSGALQIAGGIGVNGNQFLEGDFYLGNGSSDSKKFITGGGSSTGYIQGNRTIWGEGMNLTYNMYVNGTNNIVYPTDNLTSRLQMGFGTIIASVGQTKSANAIPAFAIVGSTYKCISYAPMQITDQSDATSVTTGALQILGGMAVTNNIYSGGIYNAPNDNTTIQLGTSDISINPNLQLNGQNTQWQIFGRGSNSVNPSSNNYFGIYDVLESKEVLTIDQLGVVKIPNLSQQTSALTIISGGIDLTNTTNQSINFNGGTSIGSLFTNYNHLSDGISLSYNGYYDANGDWIQTDPTHATSLLGLQSGDTDTPLYFSTAAAGSSSLINLFHIDCSTGNYSLKIDMTTIATDIFSGALIVNGGVGLMGDLYVNTIPSSPYIANSLRITGDGIYSYLQPSNSQTTGTWSDIFITPIGGDNTTAKYLFSSDSFNVLTSANATSTSSGSLIINAGMGIGQNLYIGGNTHIVNTTNAINISSAALVIDGGVSIGKNLMIGATTNTTDTLTGALIVAGGIGIGNSMSINGTLTSYATIDSTSTSSGSLLISGGLGICGNISGTNESLTGTLQINNIAKYSGTGINFASGSILTISDNTEATSISTGALQITGGASVNRNLYVGGTVTIVNTSDTSGITSGSLIINGGLGINKGMTIGGILKSVSTINSSNTSTGSLLVMGGIGVGGNISCINEYISGTLLANNVSSLSGSVVNITSGSLLRINDTTDSSSLTTGAFQVSGGAFITKTINIGGQVIVQSTTNTTGTTGGSMSISGGVGIAKDLSVAGTNYAGTFTGIGNGTFINGPTSANYFTSIFGSDSSAKGARITLYGINSSTSPGSAIISSAGTGSISLMAGNTNTQLFINGSTGQTIFANTAIATDTTSGSIAVNGGIGIGQNIIIGNNTHATSGLKINYGGIDLTASNSMNIVLNGGNADGAITTNFSKLSDGMYLSYNGWYDATGIWHQRANTKYASLLGIQFGDNNTGLYYAVAPPSGSPVFNTLFQVGSNGSTYNFQINITDDTTSTTSGALYVLGGACISKSMYIGGTLNIPNNNTCINVGSNIVGITNANINLSGQNSQWQIICRGSSSTAPSTNNSLIINNTLGGSFSNNPLIITQTSQIQITDSQNSTSTTTGALLVSGGAGIANTLSVGGIIKSYNAIDTSGTLTGSVIVAGGIGVGGGISIGGVIKSYSTIGSTSTSTGSIQVTGGIGIAGNIFCQNEYITGTLNVDTINKQNNAGNGINVNTGTLFLINDTTNSNAITSGALQVAGGVGISKNIYIGGSEVLNSDLIMVNGPQSIQMNGGNARGYLSTIGALYDGIALSYNGYYNSSGVWSGVTASTKAASRLQLSFGDNSPSLSYDISPSSNGSAPTKNMFKINGDGTFIISSSLDSSNTNSGTLQVVGGAGIGKNLNVGGTVSISNIITQNCSNSLQLTNTFFNSGSSIGSIACETAYGISGTTNNAFEVGFYYDNLNSINNYGRLCTWGSASSGLYIYPNQTAVKATAISSSATTGALTVAGGFGLGGDAYIGGSVNINVGLYALNAEIQSYGLKCSSGVQSTSTGSGSVIIAGGIGIGGGMSIGGIIKSYSTINSTSNTTGSILVTGGVGVTGNVACLNEYVTGTLNVDTLNKQTISGSGITVNSGSLFIINDTTNSNSIGSGALQVTGGTSISKNLYIGGTIVASTDNTGLYLGTNNTINANIQFNGQNSVWQIFARGSSSTSPSANNYIGIYSNTIGSTPITIDQNNVVHLSGNVNATSTSTGTLIVNGGIGVGGNLNVGGQLNLLNGFSTPSVQLAVDTSSWKILAVNGTPGGFPYANNYLTINNTYPGLYGSPNPLTINQFSQVLINDTQASTSNTTGALVVAGGVGINGALHAASKSFIIEHPDPTKIGYKLKHCVIETNTCGDNIYRYQVQTENLVAIIELPDYYSYLNTNTQVWVSAVNIMGYGIGNISDNSQSVKIQVNVDGIYNVLIIGTRKDPAALTHWNGAEIPPGP